MTPEMDGARALGHALVRLGGAALRHPWRTCEAAANLTGHLVASAAGTVALAAGGTPRQAVAPPPGDRRFSDAAWERNPWFFAASQSYLSWSRFIREVAANGAIEGPAGAKTDVTLTAVVDALAPTNFLPTNPAALRRAAETRGASLLKGLANFGEDVIDNRGRPRQVDRSAFEVGRDLAATPGQVVYRNELMELIQYAPQTETVFEVPLLMSPPWINKYYVMDLAPGRSFVEWAVQRGHTVFAISYRNPDESMRELTLDDYMLRGLATAVDVVGDITGAEEVNLAGLCVGGTLAMMLLAYLAHDHDGRVRSATLLNTLVDFSEPGQLAAFTDSKSVERLERKMAKRGFLEADEMSDTFDALRANDLVWNYVANNWLMGEPAPAFDILAWNDDSTRVSEATHSFYLRSCYLDNRLAQGTMTIADRRLNLSDVSAELYVLAARDDHITPWKSSYATNGLVNTPVRFVLSSSGHIAGIVNPPSPKRKYWTNDDLRGPERPYGAGDPGPERPHRAGDPGPERPHRAGGTDEADHWLANATAHTGSWWEDWADWIEARAGSRRPPAPLGNATHPPRDDAPGTYVHITFGGNGAKSENGTTETRPPAERTSS